MEFWFGVFHFFYSISHQPFLNRTIQLFAVINRPGSFAQHNNICRHGNLHASVLKLQIWKCLCAYLPDFSETHCLQIDSSAENSWLETGRRLLDQAWSPKDISCAQNSCMVHLQMNNLCINLNTSISMIICLWPEHFTCMLLHIFVWKVNVFIICTWSSFLCIQSFNLLMVC